MASRYFSIQFNDLSFDKKQELLEEIAKSLIEGWKQEADTDKAREYIKANKSVKWQEVYCRTNLIDWELWETEEEAKNFDWKYAIEEKAEELAELNLCTAMKYVEVEVEL